MTQKQTYTGMKSRTYHPYFMPAGNERTVSREETFFSVRKFSAEQDRLRNKLARANILLVTSDTQC